MIHTELLTNGRSFMGPLVNSLGTLKFEIEQKTSGSVLPNLQEPFQIIKLKLENKDFRVLGEESGMQTISMEKYVTIQAKSTSVKNC